MLHLILFGPPGAGKGTQSAKLIKKFGLVHLSTGDIFRANISGGTELGKAAKEFSDKGILVPDSITIHMLEQEILKHPKAKGFIFDGFPRTTAQAEALDVFLQSRGHSISRMIALEVEEEELRKRLLLRGKDSGRPDDQNPQIIQKRIDEYNSKTLPLKAFYEAQGKYSGVQGIGEIEEIFDAICSIIQPLTKKTNSSQKKSAKINVTEETNREVEAQEAAPAPKKRGRPKGSLNKKKKDGTKKNAKKKAKRPVGRPKKKKAGRPAKKRPVGRPKLKKVGRPTKKRPVGRPTKKKVGRPAKKRPVGRPTKKKVGRPTKKRPVGRPVKKKVGRPTKKRPVGRPAKKKAVTTVTKRSVGRPSKSEAKVKTGKRGRPAKKA